MRLAELTQKHERLRRTLLTPGPAIQGSILRRIIHREDPEHPGETKDYGPYYQWTRKVKGRTVIQNLTPSQAKTYGRAIRENRRLEKTIAEIRAISLKILELTTERVPKRKTRHRETRSLT